MSIPETLDLSMFGLVVDLHPDAACVDLNAPDPPEDTLCSMFDKPGIHCARCTSVRCCSPACQRDDWPRHKLLCKSFTSLAGRPSSKMRRAILLPTNNNSPQWTWVPYTDGTDIDHEAIVSRLGGDKPAIDLRVIQHNSVLNRDTQTVPR